MITFPPNRPEISRSVQVSTSLLGPQLLNVIAYFRKWRWRKVFAALKYKIQPYHWWAIYRVQQRLLSSVCLLYRSLTSSFSLYSHRMPNGIPSLLFSYCFAWCPVLGFLFLFQTWGLAFLHFSWSLAAFMLHCYAFPCCWPLLATINLILYFIFMGHRHMFPPKGKKQQWVFLI